MVRWSALLLLLILVGCPSPQSSEPSIKVRFTQATPTSVAAVQSNSELIDIYCRGADLGALMDEIGLLTGEHIQVDPNVSKSVTVSLTAIPWREGVKVIAKLAGCVVLEQEHSVLFLTQPSTVVVQFEGADVRTVLRLLAAYRGVELELPDSLEGTVDVDLKGVDESSIQTVLDQVGDYRVLYRGNGLAQVVSSSFAVPDTSILLEAAPEASR